MCAMRACAMCAPVARAGAVKEQPFRYLVVIDLEATCDFCPEPIVDASVNSEIIEFPWVRHSTPP